MPDRAEQSLSEFATSLREALAAAGADRPALEEALVWCCVDQGAPGDAFALLWEEGAPASEANRALLRAELQAFCGNEDAALALVARGPAEGPNGSLVRARVAVARGDWPGALVLAEAAFDHSGTRDRALRVAARAALEGRVPTTMEARLSELDPSTATTRLEIALLRATGAGDASRLRALVDETTRVGALRLTADAWADLARVEQEAGRIGGARAAALRAVELWDDVATSLPPPLRSGFWTVHRRSAARKLARNDEPRTPPTPTRSPGGMAALLENLRQMARERDLTRLLGRITDGAVALSGAERGFVLLVDVAGALEATTIRTAELELGTPTAQFSQSIAETVLIDGEPIVTVDASSDARVQDYLSVHQLMLKSVACLPIRAHDRTWGVLYLEHRGRPGRFSGADLRILRAYADQAAIAIETSRLLAEVAEQKAELQRTNAALNEANAALEAKVMGQTEALQRSEREVARLQLSQARGSRWGLVGESPSMRAIYDVFDRVGMSDVPVVVTGESGTGKELIARALHRSSTRADGPFVSLNCGAIPEGLLESELFGHVKGAFTGAVRDRAGVFIEATGGTLFLDELGDMPSRMQLDLLRVLQEGRVRPVGGSADTAVDVRLVAASRRPLKELVDTRTLREDLYYRLAVVELEVPPLRSRREDIPLLCEHFLGRLAEERSASRKVLDREALQRLLAYDFPGNVRELEHLLLNAAVFAQGDVIRVDDLALDGTAPVAPRPASPESYEDFKGAERDRIVATLNAHGWNRAKAARALGMARRTFYRRLKEHAIELPKTSS